MSMLKSVLVTTLLLFAFTTTEARAEHVDWSAYIDHNAKPSAPTASSGQVTDDAPAPEAARAPKKGHKTVAAKAKSQRKSKVKARAKKRRHSR